MNYYRWGLLLLACTAVLPAVAETSEHERVGVPPKVSHEWETRVGFVFLPRGPSGWDASLAPEVSYEYARTWDLALSVPYHWTAQPDSRIEARWGDPSLGLHWNGSGEPRWRSGVLVSGPPLWEVRPDTWSFSWDCSASLARDPALLGISTSVSLPLSFYALPLPRWSWALGLSFQEVVNDSMVWGLALTPRAEVGKRVEWSYSIDWTVGWFEVPHNLSTGVSSGTGAPWSWTASGGRTW